MLELHSEINSYYSNQSRYKNILLKLGIIRPPIRIEACKGALSNLENKFNTSK